MLLAISTTHQPATDLGYLLHKNPGRLHEFKLSFGKATVFYPVARKDLCQAVLSVKMDSVGLVKRSGKSAYSSLDQYVNDRPFCASSFLSVALSNVYGSALNGRCRDKPELVNCPMPLEIEIPVFSSRSGPEVIFRIFEPLAYDVKIESVPLDEQFEDWGSSNYYRLRLTTVQTLGAVLNHIYVLLPVFDRNKHYYIGPGEVDKLLHKGESWLPNHPEAEFITMRYLKYRRSLACLALRRLQELDETELLDEDLNQLDKAPKDSAPPNSGDTIKEPQLRAHDERLRTVVSKLKEFRVETVADLGCGEGRLLELLLKEPSFRKITGMDVSTRSLEIAYRRLRIDRMSDNKRARIELIQGSLLYRDRRLENVDAAVLVEVVEHIEPSRLDFLRLIIFGQIKPHYVVITTPNREYNKLMDGLPEDRLRHDDHRFEWTREECRLWAQSIVDEFKYTFTWEGIGDPHPEHGTLSQMLVFRRKEGE